MTALHSGSRTCAQCGGMNYGELATCVLCGAPMATAARAETLASFCGECGAKLEAGVTFCGECGAAVASSATPNAHAAPHRTTPPVAQAVSNSATPSVAERQSKWAPRPPPAVPSRPPSAQPTQPIRRFCPACGGTMKPGTRFCRSCGFDIQNRQQGARPAPPRPDPRDRQRTAPVAPPVSPKPPSRLLKGILRVVVPVASLVVTYYLTNKVLGPMLAQRFGDASRQLVPMLVSMVVGGVARQVMK